MVSMVPSWTETLIECGVNVVGRTRYCIHPKDKVSHIPVVGGTKDTRWQKVAELKPDLIIVDKEENTKDVLGQSQAQYFISHIENLHQMPEQLEQLSQCFKSSENFEVIKAQFDNLIGRWDDVMKHPSQLQIGQLPGVLRWIRQPQQEIKQILYLIWKDPLMTVAPNTFIGSVLSHIGFQSLLISFDKKYPEISLRDYEHQNTLLLFSSEPFPFLLNKHQDWIHSLNFPSAIVDGESFSWFGIRTLKFLENPMLPGVPGPRS